jgi:hypothetical protein
VTAKLPKEDSFPCFDCGGHFARESFPAEEWHRLVERRRCTACVERSQPRAAKPKRDVARARGADPLESGLAALRLDAEPVAMVEVKPAPSIDELRWRVPQSAPPDSAQAPLSNAQFRELFLSASAIAERQQHRDEERAQQLAAEREAEAATAAATAAAVQRVFAEEMASAR